MRIEFKNVSFSYDKKQKKALNNVSFILDKPEIIFILGHTGSGKSTLVQHLNGLLHPSEGEVNIEINGKEYKINDKEKKIKELRKNIGLVFQFPEHQLFESSVLKDVMFGPKNFGFSEKEAEVMARESLDLLGISEPYYSRSPFELSGGEKRKVAIAGVLASKPKILVLDEPTSSLDNKSTKDFFKLLNKLKEEGILVIVVSHDVNLCYEYADRIMVLDEGNLVYFGDYNNVFYNKPVLYSAKIEVPFVFKVKDRFKIESNARNIKDLIKDIKEVTLHE